MSSPSLVELGPRTPEKALSVVTHPLESLINVIILSFDNLVTLPLHV